MEKLTYFLDTNCGIVLAYEKESEFFVRFVPEIGEWEDMPVSFLSFRHDCEFKEISQASAAEKTDGCLPVQMLETYLEMIKRNQEDSR